MRSVVSNAYDTSRADAADSQLGTGGLLADGLAGNQAMHDRQGDAEIYVNLGLGKSKEWDTCAPLLILTEAGAS